MWMVFCIIWSKYVYVVCFRWKLAHEIYWRSPPPKNTRGIRPHKYYTLIWCSTRCMNVVVHSVFFLDGLLSDILSTSSTGFLYQGSESYCTGEDSICIRLYFPERLITHILIFIYIPKIHKWWLQPLGTKHVINQSMKGPCKHWMGHKRKHVYTRNKVKRNC